MTDPRTLLLAQSGDPRAQLNISRGQAQEVAQSAPNVSSSQLFGFALMNLLKQYQQLGTRPFAQQEIQAREEQAKRTQQTSPDLIGASPAIQSGVRRAAEQAITPTIQEAEESQRTFGEQIKGFGNALDNARQFLALSQDQENKGRDDARAVIKDALTLGGADALKDLSPEELTSLEKRSGYPKGYIQGLSQTIKEREIQLKKEQRSLFGGLTAGQINQTVNQIAGAFDNEQIVKSYNIALEGYETLKSLGTKTKDPASDIAFIYGFAKIMDPNSVVREGEYNTIQRYSQSWAKTFGFNAKRVFSDTNFLSSNAKQSMLNAIEAKFNSFQRQYTNLRGEYQRQIDEARQGIPRTVQDYSKAFQSSTAGENVTPKGRKFKIVK